MNFENRVSAADFNILRQLNGKFGFQRTSIQTPRHRIDFGLLNIKK